MSKLSDLLFGKSQYLLYAGSFSEDYNLRVTNSFKMGKENPIISLETISDLVLKQEVKNDRIFNTIELKTIKGITESDQMRPHLEQSLLLADITKVIEVQRNTRGKVTAVTNMDSLWEDWKKWQKTHLLELIPEDRNRKRFIENYERGLKDFDYSFRNNLQYLLLLPEIYEITSPPIPYYNYNTSVHSFISRMLGAELKYFYTMELSTLKQEGEVMDMGLTIVLDEKSEHIKILKPYYEQMGVDLTNFRFALEISYLLEKSTSKIMSAKLNLIEHLHQDMFYQIEMELTINK